MQSHQFYHLFANLPLKERDIPISQIKYGDLTISGIYHKLQKLHEKLRPLLIEEKELLEIAEGFLTLPKREE